MNDQMRSSLLKELFNRDMMKEVIRTKGNLSAPGRDNLTNPILKIEREASCDLLISYFHTIIDSGVCPED
jgi:hypothetical protein